MKQNKKGSLNSLAMKLIQDHMPCGECFRCLDLAVSRVFNQKTTPEACRHLWAVLSARVAAKGWNATKDEFEKLARRGFLDIHRPFVETTVRGLMSKLLIAEAA